jgi:hypothetical protein
MLAADPEFDKKAGGKYFADCTQAPLLNPMANDAAFCKHLWIQSEQLTHCKYSNKA